MRVSRRRFLQSAVVGAGAVTLCPGILGAAPAGRKPNILLCMTEDEELP